MAIRIRKYKGHTVALCAAKTKPKEGDLYIPDDAHHALSVKFALDFQAEGLFSNTPVPIDKIDMKMQMEAEVSE